MTSLKRWLRIGLLGMFFCCVTVQADDRQIMFDFPVGPLKKTLAAYDAVTGVSVFFSSDLVNASMSNPVSGFYTAEQALHQLLKGTGIIAKAAAEDAFVLVSDEGKHDAITSDQHYSNLVQENVLRQFCQHKELGLGQYRIALQVYLDATGKVRHAKLLDTTGERARDHAIINVIRSINMHQAPVTPDKPFVILIKPNSNVASICASYS